MWDDRRLGRGLAFVASLLAVGGCVLAPGTLDAPFAVKMHVWATPTTVEVDAPGWLADTSAVYVCSAAPPYLPDAQAARVGWTPGDDCHDFGTYASHDGLTLSLPLSDLAAPEWTAFEAAADWYVLIVDLDGERVTNAVRSRFNAPEDIAA